MKADDPCAKHSRFVESSYVFGIVQIISVMRFTTAKQVDDYLSGDRIKCLLCGRSFKMLSTHIWQKHDMSVDDYREEFGIPWSRSLTGQATRALKAKISTENFNKNPALYRENLAQGNAASKGVENRKQTEVVKNARADLARNLMPERLVNSEVFDDFIDAIKAGQTRLEFCESTGFPSNHVYKYMANHPKEVRRYRRACRANSFAWQLRNGTLNRHATPTGRFARKVKMLWLRGHTDDKIADELDVERASVTYWTQQYRIEDVRALYDKNMSDEEIAQNTPYRRDHVAKITRKWRLADAEI